MYEFIESAHGHMRLRPHWVDRLAWFCRIHIANEVFSNSENEGFCFPFGFNHVVISIIPLAWMIVIQYSVIHSLSKVDDVGRGEYPRQFTSGPGFSLIGGKLPSTYDNLFQARTPSLVW